MFTKYVLEVENKVFTANLTYKGSQKQWSTQTKQTQERCRVEYISLQEMLVWKTANYQKNNNACGCIIRFQQLSNKRVKNEMKVTGPASLPMHNFTDMNNDKSRFRIEINLYGQP